MNLLNKFHIPFSEDKVFGFLLIGLAVVSVVVVSAFPYPYENPKFIFWSILIGLSLFFLIRNKKISFSLPSSIIIVMGVMWVFALLATIFSLDSINSLVGISNRMTSSLWFYSLWLVTIFLFSTLDKQKLMVILKAWTFIGAIISFWAILQFFGVGFYEGVNAPVRSLVPSFLGNPNFAGMYISAALFIPMWFIASPQFTNRFRIFSFFVFGLNIIALVLFASRGAIIATIAGCVVLMLGFLIKKHWKYALATIVTILIIFSLSAVYINFAREMGNSITVTDSSAQQRWYLWDFSFDYITQHPIIGSGLGNFGIVYRQNNLSHLANITWFDDAHNVFIQTALSGGLFLMLTLSILFVLVFWFLYKEFKNSNKTLHLYLAAALVSWLVSAFFNPVSVPNWFILAMLLALALHSTQTKDFAKFSYYKIAGYFVSIALILIGISFLLSELFFYSASLDLGSNKRINLHLANASSYVNPTNITAILKMADKKFDSGDYTGAHKAYRQLEFLHPLSSDVLQEVVLGNIKLWNKTQDDYYKQEAYRTVLIFIQNFPNHFTTRTNSANLYIGLGDYPLALNEAREYVIQTNGSYDSWLLLANIYQKMEKNDMTKSTLKKAYESSPSSDLRKFINSK